MRRPVLRFSACLGLALLAGGAWGTARAPAAPRWRVLTLPVSGHGPFSYAEPGIVVGPGGSMIVVAASANTSAPPTFWLSRNSGLTWADGADFDQSGTSTGDADAAIGPDGYLYALNLGSAASPPTQPTNPTVFVYRSRDGRSWSGPGSFPPPHGLDQPDRPWLVVDPRHPGDVDVLNSEGAGEFVIWRSADHGATFAGPYPVTGTQNPDAGLALGSRPLFDPTRAGRMFMLYATPGPSAAGSPSGAGFPPYEFPLTQLWLASSSDAGLTWSNRLVLDSAGLAGALHDATLGHLLVATAIDAAGRLYAAFSARPGAATQTAVYLIRSGDHGASWSAPVQVPAQTRSNVMPALAVTPDGGTAYLSWYGSANPDYTRSAARWAEMAATASGLLGPRPRFTVSQVSGGAPVHVGGIDTAGNVGAQLGADWSLRDFQSIALDACGRPHLVWADDSSAPATQTAWPAPAAHHASRHHRRRRRRRRPGARAAAAGSRLTRPASRC